MSEIRPIDANALKEHKFLTPQVKVIGGRHSGKLKEQITLAYQKGWNDCIDAIIDNAPTVEHSELCRGCQYLKYLKDYEPCGKSERPKGECKDCEHYYSYCEQFTNKPRGDGYCNIVRMSSEGVTYINCSDNWGCADFCPKAEMKGGVE